MNLVSCKNCGVVLDADWINIELFEDDEGDIVRDGIWLGNDFYPKFYCPVCKNEVYLDKTKGD